MNILFLGTFLPKEYEAKFNTLSAAGNQFQCNMFKAMQQQHNAKALTYVTAPGVNLSEEERGSIAIQNIEVFLPKIDKFDALINFRKRMKDLLKWADCVITYNMVYAWFGLGDIAKKHNVKSILVLADYTPVEEESRLSRKVYAFLSKRNFSRFSKVVMLSEGSRKYIASNQESIVINGCIDWDLFKDIPEPRKKDTYNIVYTGFLGKVTGVDLLLKAFRKIDAPSARLFLCGQGEELDAMIKLYDKADSRIIFKGYISKKDYIAVLKEADLLVNPRNMNMLQNQNNFPSKVLEYMASGRPILSTKFCGWEKYKEYFCFTESNTESICKNIVNLMTLKTDEYVDIYNKNRMVAQTYKWDDFISLAIQ